MKALVCDGCNRVLACTNGAFMPSWGAHGPVLTAGGEVTLEFCSDACRDAWRDAAERPLDEQGQRKRPQRFYGAQVDYFPRAAATGRPPLRAETPTTPIRRGR